MERNLSLSMIIVSLTHCLLLCLVVAAAAAASSNITTDQQALLALKDHITYDPTNLFAHNWTSNTSVCNWIGITCDVNSHRVTALDISQFNLQGTVPPQLGNLSSLTTLNLSHNKLSGSVPTSLYTMHTLKFLDFTDNQLSGSVSSFVFNMSSILDIRLTNNRLSGEIPHEIANLRNLEALVLGMNNLVGVVSAIIFNMSSLKVLILINNSLSGSLPSRMDLSLPTIEHLNLALNRFSGTIPSSITNASKLSFLELGGNTFSGFIPNTIGNLRNLEWLGLANNSLTSSTSKLSFLSSLANCKKLRSLNLIGNPLDGFLPSSIGNLSMSLKILLIANCSIIGNIPRAIGNLSNLLALTLEGNKLTGPIPITFARLQKLQGLYLPFNKLVGSFPDELCHLARLAELVLLGNKLSGSIPSCLSEIPSGGIFANFTAESFMGNELLCGLPNLQVQPCKVSKPRTEHKSRKEILLIVIVLPLSIALTIAITLPLKSKLIECGKRCTVLSNDSVLSSQATQRRFSYLELLQATDNFAENNIIGRGGFGSVFGARLEDGMKIAIKVFHEQCASALKSFEAECEVLKNIRHRNLIKVISSCSNNDFKALVLEYMSNGSLEDWLHSSNYVLNIFQRLNIMIDVASALEYLHFDHSTPIIHCDLKPSNVLLDENMVAHLSDFGIAKLLSGEDESTMRTKTLATIGYMAPEYGIEGEVSTKSDVYSYGIMLMETFTKKKPTDEIFVGELSLKRWVNDLLPTSLVEVVDKTLLSGEEKHFASKEQSSKNIATDQKSLLAPKDHITYAPTNLLTQNWTSNTSVCTGISIPCDVNSHEVAALDISQFNLQGTIIPNTTGNLRNLKWLGLAYKLLDIFNFKIELSFLFGKLQKIKNLRLTGNPLDRILSGSIVAAASNITTGQQALLALKAHISYDPTNLLAQNSTSNTSVCNWIGITCNVNSHRVTALNISSLNLQGTIPPQLGNLSSLTTLNLSHNKLSGDIPPSIFTMHKLKFLDFSDNQLSGSLSSVTFNLSSVLDIRLDSDKLSDEIPHEIGYLPNLENLVLGFNNLVGVTPAAIFNMSTVKEIYRFITNASKLVYLDMGTNSFSGIIPNTIGNNLRNLDWLDLTYNCLTSLTLELSFLSSLTNCKKLRFLGLTGNPLDGVLPTSIGNLFMSLENIYISNCSIGGSIPQLISYLSNLLLLDLEGNKLTGSIPVTFGRLQKLQGLYLPFNKLAGSIPDHLCHLARLNTLGLAGNKFSGSIPSCLGNLTSPRSPDLGSNRLTSVLPSTFWNLKDILFFDLSSNSLDGPLSLDIGNLKVVIGINLSRNNFSGDIPSTIGGLKDLQNISLACNGLEGLIPESFGYLTGGFGSVYRGRLRDGIEMKIWLLICDFGIGRLLTGDKSMIQTETLATIGYMAPEYGIEGRVSTRSDVYSYGIMLIETFTRKKPTDEMFTTELNLKLWVNNLLPASLMEVVDKTF
ncbi:hypothetical protein WN943_027499 [Citrus x changshan-huyou]